MDCFSNILKKCPMPPALIASSVMFMSTFNEDKEVQPKHQGVGILWSYDSCLLKPRKVGMYRTGFQSHIL